MAEEFKAGVKKGDKIYYGGNQNLIGNGFKFDDMECSK